MSWCDHVVLGSAARFLLSFAQALCTTARMPPRKASHTHTRGFDWLAMELVGVDWLDERAWNLKIAVASFQAVRDLNLGC